jgi:hypothetical protein
MSKRHDILSITNKIGELQSQLDELRFKSGRALDEFGKDRLIRQAIAGLMTDLHNLNK